MGLVGERTEEVQWQMRVLKDVFNFSRGVFLRGAGGAEHVLLLELHAQGKGLGTRPRHLHLLHCPCVHVDFLDVASKPRSWQGPVPDNLRVPRPPAGPPPNPGPGGEVRDVRAGW